MLSGGGCQLLASDRVAADALVDDGFVRLRFLVRRHRRPADIASISSHRSCPSSVEQVPSVIESPNATIAPVEMEERDVDRFQPEHRGCCHRKRRGCFFPALSPEPFAVRYDVTCAPAVLTRPDVLRDV